MGAAQVIGILEKAYPQEVKREDPFKVLIGVMLSHQTTDRVSWPAAERLLGMAGTPEKIVKMPVREIARVIFPVGFYNTKARNIKAVCRILAVHGGRVPRTKEELVQLPGVGPKSASIVMAHAFGVPTIAADTHVNRISQRLGWAPKGSRPERTQELIEMVIPRRYHLVANRLLVEFGRDICQARRPQCYRCPIYRFCKFEVKKQFKQLSDFR
jgi:endonuclease III